VSTRAYQSRSDIHFWHAGRIGPMVVDDEHILGHESAGVVISAHSSVKTLQVGDRVAIEPGVPCTTCTQCLTGHYNACPTVAFKSTPPLPGLLRRYIVHPEKWCHKLPDALTWEQGALLEPLSVALAGTWGAGVKLGDRVAVCGAGPIGLAVAACVRAAGASRIVMTDLDSKRLKFATTMVSGVTTLLVEKTWNEEQVADKIKEKLGGEADVVMECTGAESSIAGGIWAVRFGGTVFVVGVGKDKMEFPFMRLSTMEVQLKFQYRYANTWPRAIELVDAGLIDLRKMVSHDSITGVQFNKWR
jgi:L-iditol 2-dehydrogenase